MSEYLVQQPETLEGLAMAKLGDWIALQAEKFLSPISTSYILELFQCDAIKAEELLSHQIEIIRTVLDHNLPSRFHNKLVIEAMRALSELLHRYEWFSKKFPSHSLEWKMIDDDGNADDESSLFKSPNISYVVGRMVETLFTKSLTSLSLDYKAMEKFGAAFYSKSCMLTSLTRLSISLGYCDEETEAKVIQAIKGLHSLKYLSLVDNCTDDILKCVTKNCTLIEELIISNTDINNKSVEVLTHLPNLRIVDLYETEVSQEGIETLLMSCENIETIDIFSEVIACALENIVSSEQNAGKQFKLNSFDMDYETITLKQLQIAVRTCPQIQKMTIMKDPDQSFQNYVMALNGLQDLRDLELEFCNFYADQVEKILEIGGRKLVHLKLDNVQKMDINSLICINKTCPNLESLTISECTFVNHSSVIQGLFHCKLTVSHIQPFENMKKLSLHVKDFEIEPDELLFFIFSNCPIVEFIDTELPLTDDIMLKVLNKNPLIYLKEWKMWRNTLTKSVLDRIVQNCISPPNIHTHGGH